LHFFEIVNRKIKKGSFSSVLFDIPQVQLY
jgi:hypothetical protein